MIGRTLSPRGGVAPQRPAAARAARPGAAPRRGARATHVARAGWDLGRFAKTVLFFNDPSKLFSGLFSGGARGGGEAPLETLVRGPPAPPGAPDGGVVLVTGATGGVGKRVVELLLAKGRRVRAVVRDVEKARGLLASLPAAPGGVLELAPADVTQPATLRPEMLAGVRQLVSCCAVKVQPKEGDTADRAKYFQGIKFFDPEIADNSPEAVESTGMRTVLSAAAPRLGLAAGAPLLLPRPDFAARWGALDDVVMGGVSESGLTLAQGAGEGGGAALVFRGVVSTDNSGGFVSVRCRNWEPPLDLGAYQGLRIRLKGDGLRYKVTLRTDSGWDGVGYCCSFDTAAGEWQSVELPFADFFPVFRARRVRGGDAKPLDPSTVYSLQLMLSKFEYDGELNPAFAAGPFELPITEISAYLASPVTPRLVHVSSAGVTRPNRPGIDVEQEPPAVKLNDALGGLLTWKLAGEDAVRGCGVPAAVVRPCALTEEPRGMPVQIDQGDTIKGKIGRDDVAELCVALLDCPAAAGATFEIKSTVPFSQPWTADDSAAAPARDWGAVLAGSGLAAGVTGKTVGGVYSGRRPEAEVAAEAAVATVKA
ncbi:hypothetical protein Rsub_04999 [Raphidocelis subcapitata]|uniref:NADH:ubiquinone oxidoreductase intermediate-associated protein 30 domain-containing protein n=1 Tax=Raphidocelis subcapitata TaxID=307507 RepID=A0A2V0NW80_9CHLO|nr:hypothetical protein Rsub_04999 [Raphidocelis subcapitata]|eukprot:GBF91894.1 hypothetical protein Rsub_04999 [Raphidocelis subcapitata]